VSIDGLRLKAQRTGEYDGQDEPEFEYAPDGSITLARVRVYRKGISRPFVGTARWSEYVQTKKEGGPTRFWSLMGHVMLGKCAEALAMRKAFPDELAGLYTDAEMMQAGPVVQSTAQAAVNAIAQERMSTVTTFERREMPRRELPSPAEQYSGPPAASRSFDDPVIPFGKNKGAPVSALSDKQLSWYRNTFSEKLEKDPQSRYAGEWRGMLAAIQRVMDGDVTPPPANAGDAYEGPDMDAADAEGEGFHAQFDE
jgi:hypothetical protein